VSLCITNLLTWQAKKSQVSCREKNSWKQQHPCDSSVSCFVLLAWLICQWHISARFSQLKWRGYKGIYQEPRATLMEDVPALVRAFDAQNQLIWSEGGWGSLNLVVPPLTCMYFVIHIVSNGKVSLRNTHNCLDTGVEEFYLGKRTCL